MNGFFLHLSSDDSKTIYTTNTYKDFTVQLPKYYNLDKNRGFLGWEQSWNVAITEIALVGLVKPETLLAPNLDSTVTVLCDVASDSYIAGCNVPLLRILNGDSELSGLSSTLAQSYYVEVGRTRFNKIRIYLKTEKQQILDVNLWPDQSNARLRCTLHFQRQ